MSYKDKLDAELESNKEYNSKRADDWFKFKEGDNTFRVLTEPVMLFEKFKVGICYTDCGYQGSPRLLTYILDRADNKVKLAKLPYTLGEQILNMENDQDYGFSGFPIPYDITIKAIGAGSKEVKYSAPLPRPVKPLSIEVSDSLKDLKSCSEIIEKMKVNQKQKHVDDGTWQKELDRKEALKKEMGEMRAKPGESVKTAPDYYPTDTIDPKDIPWE